LDRRPRKIYTDRSFCTSFAHPKLVRKTTPTEKSNDSQATSDIDITTTTLLEKSPKAKVALLDSV